MNAICIDATGQMNAYGCMLYAITGPDPITGRDVPIAYVITGVDCHHTERKMLDAATEAWKVYFKSKIIMIGKSDADHP